MSLVVRVPMHSCEKVCRPHRWSPLCWKPGAASPYRSLSYLIKPTPVNGIRMIARQSATDRPAAEPHRCPPRPDCFMDVELPFDAQEACLCRALSETAVGDVQ